MTQKGVGIFDHMCALKWNHWDICLVLHWVHQMTETNQTFLGATLAKTKPDKLTPQEYNILIKTCVPAFSSDSGACDRKF